MESRRNGQRVDTAAHQDPASARTPLDRAIGMFAAMVTVENPTIAEKRAGYDRLLNELPVPDGLSIEEEILGGVRCLRVRANPMPKAALLMLHGGGYVMGSADGYRGFAGALATATGLEVVVCDYRLAPDHPFPAALDDARASYLALIAQYGSQNTVVLGDSAGGGLATGLLLAVRDEGLAPPACGVLICPELDLTASSDSMERNRHRDPVLRQDSIRFHAGLYLAGRDPRETVYASPHWDPCDNLPPLLILTTDTEILYDEAVALTHRANDSGGEAELLAYPGLLHVWPLFWSFLPEARQAISDIARYLNARLNISESEGDIL